MPITKRRLIPILLLFVYAMGLLLVAPHADLDLISGSGNLQLATHADADNCKHIPISNLDSCPLCSSVAGRAILAPAPFTLEFIDAAPAPQIFSFSSSYCFALLTSISRRGPPLSSLNLPEHQVWFKKSGLIVPFISKFIIFVKGKSFAFHFCFVHFFSLHKLAF